MAKSSAWQRKGIGKAKLSVKKEETTKSRLSDFTYNTGCDHCVENSFNAQQILSGEKNG
jgi:hypothetical protein